MGHDTTTKIHLKSVIKRGFCLDKEYERIFNFGTMRRFNTNEDSFWGYPLTKVLFVFCNHPTDFPWNLRPVVGMVGKYYDFNQVDVEGSIELFNKVGQAAIDYHNGEGEELD